MMKQRVEGRLRLDFRLSEATRCTTLDVLEQNPPLTVIRAFTVADGAALVHLHNVSGGVLGGDSLELFVHVGREAHAQLTTTSATRLYRNREEGPGSVQVNEMTVEEHGLLEMLPDPLIPYAGSSYSQISRIELSNEAGLFWWETIAPGREARGELFEYRLLALDLQIRAEGRPVALEYARLKPDLHALTSPARFGDYRYLSTFYICRVGLPPARWTALEAELTNLAGQLSRPGETVWGVSALVAHGLVVRALSRYSWAIAPGLRAFWRAAKLALYGMEAIPPRKVH
jgi:urease accessory protein